VKVVTQEHYPFVTTLKVCAYCYQIWLQYQKWSWKTDILEAAGNLQLCAGQEAGCEAAVHAMHSFFHSSTTQAVLLADASNAFNSLNRRVSLHFSASQSINK